MPIFHCPVCNHKTLTEKEEREHARTHQKSGHTTETEVKKIEEKNKIKPAESEVKKTEESKKTFIMPDFIKRFLHKNVLITMIDGSTISGQLTGFNNYDLMLDDKILILKHAMMKMQEVETKL